MPNFDPKPGSIIDPQEMFDAINSKIEHFSVEGNIEMIRDGNSVAVTVPITTPISEIVQKYAVIRVNLQAFCGICGDQSTLNTYMYLVRDLDGNVLRINDTGATVSVCGFDIEDGDPLPIVPEWIYPGKCSQATIGYGYYADEVQPDGSIKKVFQLSFTEFNVGTYTAPSTVCSSCP